MAAWTVQEVFCIFLLALCRSPTAASFLAPGSSSSPNCCCSRSAAAPAIRIHQPIVQRPSSNNLSSNQRSRFSSAVYSTTRKQEEEEDPASSQEESKEDGSSFLDQVYRQFLRSLWKGMALPFPQLRNVILPRSLKAIRGRKGDSSSFTVGLSFREGLFALALYLASGVLAYSVLLENWSIVDALYFTCVCFSTVGYGDLCPTTRASKLFTVFFGMGGIAFLGAAVAAVGGRFVEAEINAVKTARRQSGQQLMHLFEGMPKVLSHFRKKSEEEQRRELLEKAKSSREELQRKFRNNLRHRIEPFSTSVEKIIRSTLLRSLPALSVVVAGGLIMHRLNGKTWSSWEDAIYYALVTASTIGFGDYAPVTRAARLFAVVFIPLSVAAAGELLSGVAMALVHRRQREVYEKQLEEDLTIEHLKVMDTDEDGKITREEYIMFMLTEMGRVSRSELDELIVQFDRLDVTCSGYLDNEDLELMAKLRGATVKEPDGV